jgi:formylglycine-generating enzyme required for sulfatase activity
MTATITLTPESTLGVGSTMINERDGAEMVYVPAGEFLMGYDESQRYNERPEHTVYLDSYWIYKFEVTNSQFYTFILSQGVNFNSSLLFNRVDNDNILFQENEEWLIDEDFVDYPIKGVTWNGAIEYCEWAGGEIPTEAEWEKAARGTDGRLYPWGNNFPTASLTNFEPYSTKPVGTYLEGISPYGALDMTGNVYEWVSDWYSADYYSISPDENPRGPEIGSSRILRGGYWVDKGWYGGFRVTYRIPSRPDNTYSFYGYGFRCIIPEE